MLRERITKVLEEEDTESGDRGFEKITKIDYYPEGRKAWVFEVGTHTVLSGVQKVETDEQLFSKAISKVSCESRGFDPSAGWRGAETSIMFHMSFKKPVDGQFDEAKGTLTVGWTF